MDSLLNFDFGILDFIQNNLRCAFFDTVSPIFDNAIIVAVVCIVTALILLFFRKTRSTGVMMLIGIAAAFIISELILKNTVCRIRPCNMTDMFYKLVESPDSFSFPSSHMAVCFASSTVIFCKFKWPGILAFAISLFIGFTRMYLYVHFPTDVFAGIIIGIAVGIIIYIIFRKSGLDDKISQDRTKTRKEVNHGET